MRRAAASGPAARRWLRGLWPDDNPLRRRADRVEAWIVGGLLAAFLLCGPLAAVLAGYYASAFALRVARDQQAAWRQVPAVLLANAPASDEFSYSGVALSMVRARWTAPDGVRRTGSIPVLPGARAGSTVQVWVDASGQLTDPPLRPDQVTGQSVLASVCAPIIVGLVLLAAGGLVHSVVDRRRMAAWDADWQATGPRWTRLR